MKIIFHHFQEISSVNFTSRIGVHSKTNSSVSFLTSTSTIEIHSQTHSSLNFLTSVSTIIVPELELIPKHIPQLVS